MKLLNKLAAAFISGALVIGVGVAIVSNEGFAKEPSAVKAATVGSTYTEGDAVTSSTFDANASYVLKSTNGYYYTGSVSSKWGLTSNSFASAAVITVSGTATSFNAVDTVSNKQIKAVKSNFQLDATGTNLTLGDATVNGKTYSCVQAKGFYLKCNTGSQNKFRFYDSSSYTTTMLPVQLVKLVSGSTTVNVTGVSLNKTELSLTLGVNEEETLTATVAPEDATNKNVSWKTSDGSVATVNNGKVKAVGEGTATITVTTEDGSKTASCEVTVNPAPVVYATGISLSIADTIHTLDSNDTITLVKDSENGTAVIEFNVEVSPSDSTNKGYSWSCNATDNSVITYTDEPNIAVDTSKEGNYTLTVIASGSETTGAVNKTIYIKVEESNIPTLESVSVSGTPLKETQYVGDAFDYSGLTFTAHYSDNSTQSVDGGDIIWDALVAGENPTGTYNDVTVTVSSVTVVQGAFSDIANIGGTTQYISATENGSTYYLKTNGTKAPLATTNKGEATPFTVTLVANDTYQFENGGQYLYCTNANDGIRFGPSTNVNWIVTGPTTNKTGSFTVMNTATNRYLSLYNFQDFRSYNSATATNRHVNTDFETSSSVTGLTITAAEGAQTRFLKDSTFDPVAAGYSASLNYSNGTSEDVTSAATWTLDTSTVTNSAVITASYSGESDSVENITIYEVVATKLAFNLSNMKISYATGETLNTAGLVVMGLHDNDQIVIDSCDLSNCTFTPTALSTAGTQTITVVFTNTNGETATGTFEVTVADVQMYTKVTSVEDITFGDSYIFGVENANKASCLMGAVSTTSTKYMTSVTSQALTTDYNGIKVDTLEDTVHPFTIVAGSNNGVAMYDLVANKFIEGSTANSANVKDAYSADCEWHFSFEDGHLNVGWKDSTRVLAYNVGSPRFATYAAYAKFNNTMNSGNAHPVLYKLSGSSVKSSVESFNTGSLLMNQHVGDNSYNADRCTDNYAEMKAEFVELSEAARMLFLDGTTFSSAYARFNAWCVANGQEYDSTLNVFSAKQGSRFTVISDSSTTTIVVICSLLTLSTIAVYFSVRKKKEI